MVNIYRSIILQRMTIKIIKERILQSKLFKDSFWALVGNGIGDFLLLVSGILIARFLGKDLYGEYGVVKTNMFYMAGFSTFGLVYSSTRYISRYIRSDSTRILGIISNATKITLIFSSLLAIVLITCASCLESFLNVPGIAPVFRALSVIIVLKAMSSTGNGILAGLGEFKLLAKSTVTSGLVMFVLCVPLTYFWGLYGALSALTISQLLNFLMNYFYIHKISKLFPIYYVKEDSVFDLLKFSFPIALQEISYAICNWAGILLLTKLSSLSEVGLYTATTQWNAVITMIPGMLANVVLSHLSGTSGHQQKSLIYRILGVYLFCTIVPFLCVYSLSDLIVAFYGTDFSEMKTVFRLNIFITIPACCSEVFKAEMIAIGRTWTLFSLRMLKDVVLVVLAFILLNMYNGLDGAYYYSMSTLVGTIVFFIGVLAVYVFSVNKSYK